MKKCLEADFDTKIALDLLTCLDLKLCRSFVKFKVTFIKIGHPLLFDRKILKFIIIFSEREVSCDSLLTVTID